MGDNFQKTNRPSRLGLRNAGGGGGGGGQIVEVQGGHIVRSTGRKDRHSKVCTAKGPRDRRVRLSAHTAIQFYDVQDRLGYDRPSKAVDWLITKAKSAIDELAELPPWKPTSGNFQQNLDDENQLNQLDEQQEDDDMVDNQMGNIQNSSFLPQSLDSLKSFFPMGGGGGAPSPVAPPPPQPNNNNNNNDESSAMQFHHHFPPSELLSRTNNQNQELKLSLQSFQDPIHPHHHHHHHHQTEQGINNNNNNIFFDGSGWPEPGGFQRLVAWGGGGGGGSGDGVSNGFMFTSPPPPTQTPPFLQPLFGQTTNNQLFNYISQRGPLQSSNTPSVRAWIDPASFTGAEFDHQQTQAFHHQSSVTGYTFGNGSGYPGFHIPARIQGDEEEHDGGLSDKPSSASSDSHH